MCCLVRLVLFTITLSLFNCSSLSFIKDEEDDYGDDNDSACLFYYSATNSSASLFNNNYYYCSSSSMCLAIISEFNVLSHDTIDVMTSLST